jgi:hypothetical protein
MQQVLDITLERAPDAAKDRFALLCAQRHGPASLSDGGSDVALDLNRRELLRLLAVTGAAIGVSNAEEIDGERIIDPGADTSPALLDEYEKINARLWRVYAQAVPKRAVASLVNTHLTVIAARLRDASEPARSPAKSALTQTTTPTQRIATRLLRTLPARRVRRTSGRAR